MKSTDSLHVARMTPHGVVSTRLATAPRPRGRSEPRVEPRAPAAARHPLSELRNVGPATCADFERLGITSVAQLARADPDLLFKRLERITGQRQDPCVWDVFAAAIFQAKTGKSRAWWAFTPIRKAREERREKAAKKAQR